MLTDTQREMINERKEHGDAIDTKIDTKRRKYIDFTLRNYIKKHLDSVVEIPEILEVLPRNQIRAIITPDHIIGILKLLESVSSTFLAPIEFDKNGTPHAVYKFQLIQKLPEPIDGKDQQVINMKCVFPAEPWEIKFATALNPYMSVLVNLFEKDFGMVRFDIEDDSYASWLSDLVNKRGQPFKIEAGSSCLLSASLIENGELVDMQIETRDANKRDG